VIRKKQSTVESLRSTVNENRRKPHGAWREAKIMAAPAAVYRPRNPQATDYYRCVQDHLEPFIQVYEERFERTYGFFRPYLQKVICRHLDCGDLHNGFARVKCKDCSHEYLLAFSCKRRHFCPSCHQKRVVEFGEWLCANVLKRVPHRHFVFSLPKILRRYFLGAYPRPDRGIESFCMI
jgi:hypothetical protein